MGVRVVVALGVVEMGADIFCLADPVRNWFVARNLLFLVLWLVIRAGVDVEIGFATFVYPSTRVVSIDRLVIAKLIILNISIHTAKVQSHSLIAHSPTASMAINILTISLIGGFILISLIYVCVCICLCVCIQVQTIVGVAICMSIIGAGVMAVVGVVVGFGCVVSLGTNLIIVVLIAICIPIHINSLVSAPLLITKPTIRIPLMIPLPDPLISSLPIIALIPRIIPIEIVLVLVILLHSRSFSPVLRGHIIAVSIAVVKIEY